MPARRVLRPLPFPLSIGKAGKAASVLKCVDAAAAAGAPQKDAPRRGGGHDGASVPGAHRAWGALGAIASRPSQRPCGEDTARPAEYVRVATARVTALNLHGGVAAACNGNSYWAGAGGGMAATFGSMQQYVTGTSLAPRCTETHLS